MVHAGFGDLACGVHSGRVEPRKTVRGFLFGVRGRDKDGGAPPSSAARKQSYSRYRNKRSPKVRVALRENGK